MADDYEVGYGRPPRHTRFRKGRSGNPKGRPKGSLNLRSELKGLLAAKTKIKVNGEVQTVRTTTALCMSLVQKAMGGDVKALTTITQIVGPEMTDELQAAVGEVTASDMELLCRSLERRDRAQGGGKNDQGGSHDH